MKTERGTGDGERANARGDRQGNSSSNSRRRDCNSGKAVALSGGGAAVGERLQERGSWGRDGGERRRMRRSRGNSCSTGGSSGRLAACVALCDGAVCFALQMTLQRRVAVGRDVADTAGASGVRM